MSIDFLKHLSPEARERIERQRQAHERDVAETRELSNEALCERTEYYLKNCQFPHQWQPGEPVYDGVIAHVIIPELLRRVRGGS